MANAHDDDSDGQAVKSWWRQRNRSLVLSYLEMRRAIGVLGLALPALCLFAAVFPSESDPLFYDTISMYYYSSVRDAFVAIVASLGLFLACYRGHDRRDNVLTTLTGLAALGVVLFPCQFPDSAVRQGVFLLAPRVSNVAHLSSAGVFFLLLALNSLFLFTESDKPIESGSGKSRQNILYRATGGAIIATLVAIVVIVAAVPEGQLRSTRILFWLESFMLLNFGVSWLVKGNTLRPKGRRRASAQA